MDPRYENAVSPSQSSAIVLPVRPLSPPESQFRREFSDKSVSSTPQSEICTIGTGMMPKGDALEDFHWKTAGATVINSFSQIDELLSASRHVRNRR